MTTGYEAATARNIESVARSLQETNRILERIATALEVGAEHYKPDNVDELYTDDVR